MNINPCYISGVNVTKHTAFNIDMSWKEMVTASILDAIDDAGYTTAEVDAGVVAYHGELSIETGNIGPLIADATGLEPIGITGLSGACAGGATALYHAAALVMSGMAKTVVAAGFEKGGDLYDYIETISPSSEAEYDYAFGMTHIDWLALITNTYMRAWDANAEAITTWIEDRHRCARLHPKSFYYGQNMPSRSDLERNMMFIAGARADGAAAVVLSSTRPNRHAARPAITLAGIGYGSGSAYLPHRLAHGGPGMLVSANTQYAAHQAYRMAKLADPREVDFLQVSDVAPGYVFLELEALGLYTRGESWQGVLDGRHALAGRYPTNTHGGSVAFGHASSASGLVNVVESVDQFLERAGERQIRGRPLRSCICQSSGGSQCNNVVAVLRSEA